MNIFKYTLFLWLFLGAALSSSAQVPELIKDEDFRRDAKAAVDSIYNFNFEGSDNTLSVWKEEYPQHPLWTLLDGMEFWWEVLSDLEDTSHDERFFEMMKKADYEARKILYENKAHADGLIIKAISNGYMARQYSNRNEWITSLNYARKAMNAYDYLLQIQPELSDLKLAEGLKLYYASYLPDAYPVVKTVSWFLPEGDKEKGLQLLEEASEEAIFAGAEARYFYGNINYNYEKEYSEAVDHFERLQATYPNNNYYARILAKIYYRQHRYDRAEQYITETLSRWQQLQLPFQKVLVEELLTWKGRILERNGKKADALACYKTAFEQGKDLPNTQSRSFNVVAGYLAGKLLYEQQNFEEAKQILQQVADAEASQGYQERARQLLDKMS